MTVLFVVGALVWLAALAVLAITAAAWLVDLWGKPLIERPAEPVLSLDDQLAACDWRWPA